MPDDATATLADLVTERVRDARLRLTASRRAVLAVLVAADRPLTLPEILRADPGLAQSSAYRNLAELIGAGIVHRVDTGEDHAHYELADDLTSHHHHLICTGCSKVLDVEFPAGFEVSLEATATEVAATRGFTLEGHRLDLLGLCVDCADGTTADLGPT